MIHIKALVFFLLLSFIPGLGAQEILTAADYFNRISGNYSVIEDYQAEIVITREETVMKGTLYHKVPDKLRIDFTEPEEQVISFDGKRLAIYIPRYRVVMSQHVTQGDQLSAGASIATREGLLLLKRNYSVAYLESPDPVPLDSDDPESEPVVKLKLVWRSPQEGFRQIDLSVNTEGYIIRVVGITPENEEIQFDFSDIVINQNIPDTRFDYTLPAAANVFENFLFDPGE